MNYNEYQEKLELLDKEEILQKEKFSKFVYGINNKMAALASEYVCDNTPCEIKPGELISVKWYSHLGRHKSKYINAPIPLRYTIKKDTYYTETFVFNGWKIDKYGVLVPIQCDTECRFGTGDDIVSVQKETMDAFCIYCDKYDENGIGHCHSYSRTNNENNLCKGFYRLINLDNTDKL